MALNCIVDDSALLAGFEANAKYNLTQWVADGAINAFVPLYTLERLNFFSREESPRGEDANKALQWLDKLTTQTYKRTAGKVQLQGPDDQFGTWREVEKYKLPDTPLSSSRDEMQALAYALERDLGMDKGDLTGGLQTQGLDCGSRSPSVSPTSSLSASPETNNTRKRPGRGKSGSPGGIPQRVRPLINFVVWRAHHEDPTIDGSGHYILLTNDVRTQRQAQKFGIRAKQMSQVSAIVARNVGKRLSSGSGLVETSDMEGDDEDIGLPPDERPAQEDADDRILFDPTKRPQSSRGVNILDPNSFGRQPLKGPMPAATQPMQSPRGPANGSRGRGANSKRGKAGTTRSPNAPPVPQSPKQTPRGSGATGRPQAALPDPTKPIDPDSYARAAPGARSRGRGGNRGRLWEPT